MAHHKSTPKSILDAPERTVESVVEHEGRNRRQRRHFFDPKTTKRHLIPARLRKPATNTPFVKGAPENAGDVA